MRPVFVLIAETVLSDQGTNMVSAINLLEEFHPAGYPLLIPRFTILALTVRDEGDPDSAEAVINISLDEAVLFEDRQDLNFGPNSLFNRSILQFQGFILPQPGVIRVRFTVAGETAESYPLPASPAGAQPEPNHIDLTGGPPTSSAP